MVNSSGPRHRAARFVRIVAAVLLAAIVAMPLDLGPAVAATADGLPVQAQLSSDQPPPAPRPAGRVAPNQIGIRAKSAFEQTWNPFGDEWAAKTTSNPSIPVGITPACYRQPGKPWASR